MESKKRKLEQIYSENDKFYKFQIILPNGISETISKRNPVNDSIPLKSFLQKLKIKYSRETEVLKKERRNINWDSNALFLKDFDGNSIKTKICFSDFQANELHRLWLIDGGDEATDTIENMWDLTPDTDLLTELPEDYTFETALADLIDNALQAVWSNGEQERKLISIEVHNDKVCVFDSGPGMDDTKENSIVKWGKMGASVHRSSKTLAIGGKPPFLKPYFGMFGYGGTIASMHLGSHAIVSAKTKKSKKVYWLRLDREALLKRSGSSSSLNWKAPGGIRDPSRAEIDKSPHGSFTKIYLKPKLKIPDIFQLQCKLKDIYFPYIQCDAKAGRTTRLIEFQVNGVDLTEIDGGEVATTNLHSCNGPDFVLNLHFSIQQDDDASKSPSVKSSREGNARLKCVYLPVVEGKESIDKILEKLKSDGCETREDFETFGRISIRRLGRLLPDARWDLLPFMKPKQTRGNKLHILRRCCRRIMCFIDTDAGFNPIPSKTDLAPQHPFTKALKDLGTDPRDKDVEVRIIKNERKISLSLLEKEFQDWLLLMHGRYDDEFNCGNDEPILLVNALNKEALGIKSDVVRVHQSIIRKGKSWRNGQKVKIPKGAGPGCYSRNIFVTLEYFLLEGLQGDFGGEARVICRPLGVSDDDGCELRVDATGTHLELGNSISLPVTVLDSEKCNPANEEDWNLQSERLSIKMPSAIDVLGLKQCQELDIDGALPTKTPISAGTLPPTEVVAVLRPLNFSSSSISNDLDQKYIIRDIYEMSMDIKFKANGAKISNLAHTFSATARPTSRKGLCGLYIFDLSSELQLFRKAGVYSFSFSLKNQTCKSCEVHVHVEASSTIKHWELVRDDKLPQFSVRAGSIFPPFCVARFDMYDNCVPFNSIPGIAIQVISNDVVLCEWKKAKVELSPDNCHIIVQNVRITPTNVDEIRPGYEACLNLSLLDKVPILSIPCRVFPGPLQSVEVHLLDSINGLLPKKVILDAKLEMFDRHGNHVKEGTEVELKLHGFILTDQIGVKREADKDGFVDLNGVLKVTGAYGELVSISIVHDKNVILTKKWRVEKRALILATKIPDLCRVGSTLEDVTFEVVDSEGRVDQSIHDDEKHESHILKIKTNLPNFDNSVRFTFRHGRCVIPSIALPREGRFCIEAVHSPHLELRLKFKVDVFPAMECDKISDLQHSTEGGNQRSQSKRTTVQRSRVSDGNSMPHADLFESSDSAKSVRSEVKEKQGTAPKSQRNESRVPSPIQTSMKELHPDFSELSDTAKSMKSKARDKQTTDVEMLLEKYDDDILKSPEANVMSLDSPTVQHEITLMEPEFGDLQGVEEEIRKYGLDIKNYEDVLKALQVVKDATILNLQASMELQPLEPSDYEFHRKVMLDEIEHKVGSAAAVYSAFARNLALKEKHFKTASNLVGLVAFLAMAPSSLVSRSLAEYLGEDQMLAIVCQSTVKNSKDYESALNSIASELDKDIRGSCQLIFLGDIRAYTGGIDTSDPQKRLSIPRPKLADGTTPLGFLGHAVNMIDVDGTETADGYGLRETLFYRLFGELQVYDSKDNMTQAHECIDKDGAVSLDGGIIRGNGIISFGCKPVDVLFPVTEVEHRLIEREETKPLIEKKNAAKEAIEFIHRQRSMCMKRFQERKAGFLKLVEEQEHRLSQESHKALPLGSPHSV